MSVLLVSTNNKGYTLKWSLQMIIKLPPDRFFRNWYRFPGVVWRSSFHYQHASVLIDLQLYLGFSDNHLSSSSQQHEHGQNLCHWFSTQSLLLSLASHLTAWFSDKQLCPNSLLPQGPLRSTHLKTVMLKGKTPSEGKQTLINKPSGIFD